MSAPSPRTAGLALGLALGLGILADRLLWMGPRGPGFAIWILLLAAAAVLLTRRVDASRVPAIAGWSAVGVAAAAATMLRDAPVTTLAMLLVVAVAASMALLRAGGVRLGATRPADHVVGLALVPGRAALGVLPLLRDVEPRRTGSRRRLVGIARGALLAVPLLMLFGGLFAAADAGFERYATRIVHLLSEDVLAHIALALVFAWLSAGLLSGLRARDVPDPLAAMETPRFGADETATVLGLLALLFLAFVGFQLGYLFGGRATIEAASGLTVAEYARRGFFELLVVGLGTIVVLLVADSFTTARGVYRALAAVLVACVLVILASAAQRMILYTGAFGLSVDRITASTVMAWLAAVLVLFAATVLRERPAWFASAAMLAGIVAAFVLVAIDPGARSARSILDRAADGRRDADVEYLLRLEADAVPALVARLGELPADARCTVAERLLRRHAGPDREGDADWRTWNAARAAARDAVRENVPELEAAEAGCAAGEEESR